MAQIWRQNAESQYNTPGKVPAYLTPAQALRYERVRQARLLYDGRHREYYLDEGRTQFDYPEMEVNGRRVRPYIAYNLLGLISNKNADLLFGQEPLIQAKAENTLQQEAINALVKRSSLHTVLLGCAVTASCESETFLEAVVYEGEVYLREPDSIGIYPVGKVQADGQHAAYEKLELDEEGKLLLVTTYRRGLIERALYEITGEGTRGKRKDVDLWPGKTAVWGERVETGLRSNLITWIPNLMLDGEAISDYDGALDLQDKVNSANTQIARVLAKHADPKMAIPAEAFDEDGNFKASRTAIPFRTKEEIPAYIVWQAELEAAFKDRDFAVAGVLIKTEMSPVLLGLQEGSAPEAYKTLRLRAFNSLSKAQRKSLYVGAGVARAVQGACELENVVRTRSYPAGYPVGPVSATLRDGIPVDETDQANAIAALRAVGGISRKRMVRMQIPDPIAAAAEEAELAEEAKANMPSVLLNAEPTEDQPQEVPPGYEPLIPRRGATAQQ